MKEALEQIIDLLQPVAALTDRTPFENSEIIQRCVDASEIALEALAQDEKPMVSYERFMSVEKELADMTAEFMSVAKQLAQPIIENYPEKDNREPVAWIDIDEKGSASGLRYWSEPDNRHEVALYILKENT